MREFTDPETGRKVRQLTEQGNNVHLYFTENAFDAEKPEIYFRSDRDSGKDLAPHENPHYQLYKMNHQTGETTRLTDEDQSVTRVTKTPDSALVVYLAGNRVRKLDTRTGETTTLYEEKGPYGLLAPSISANRRHVGFCRNEKVIKGVGANYSGFKDGFYRTKDGRITLAKMDGTGHFDVKQDTHWVGHFQFSPLDPTLAMYCHEGPWNLVNQRVWLLDVVSREVQPCFRQEEHDAIGHEFWTQDGLIFLDNRGPGHDGTVTSDRTQAVASEVAISDHQMQPFVSLMHPDGHEVRRIDMPFYCNHYHANPDNTLLVGDDLDHLVLIDLKGEQAALEVLLSHGTSWHTQESHCHPTFSWDGKRILYASDRGGRVQLYLTELD